MPERGRDHFPIDQEMTLLSGIAMRSAVFHRQLKLLQREASRDTVNGGKLVTQHGFAWDVEPLVQNARIDPAEVHLHLEIAARVEVREAWLCAVHAGLDAGTEKEHRLGLAVVGSSTVVFGRPASELTVGEGENAVLVSTAGQVPVEGRDRFAEFVQEDVEAAWLIGMSVVSAESGDALGGVVGAGAQAAVDHPGDGSHRGAELGVRVSDRCFVLAGQLAEPGAGGVGIDGGLGNELEIILR